MAGPELQAFRELDKMGLILEGEFFSPFLAGQDHYTKLLAAIKADRLGIKRRGTLGINRSNVPHCLLREKRRLTVLAGKAHAEPCTLCHVVGVQIDRTIFSVSKIPQLMA